MTDALDMLDPWLVLGLPWVMGLAWALARIAGVFLALPQFASRGVPLMLKSITALGIANILFWVNPTTVSPSISPVDFIVGLTAEFAFGLALGFLVHIVLASTRIAGQIVGIEMGLSMSAIADPLSQTQGTAISSLFGMVAAQLLLIIGIDRSIIAALARSVESQPLGSARLLPSQLMDILELGGPMFTVALNLALPIASALWAMKLALALMARIAPQLQIFSIAFALTLILGFFVLIWALPGVGLAIADHLSRLEAMIWQLASTIPDGQ